MVGNYHDPIFIHSLFRSGSTYMFNVFRRSPEGYWCYQEPFNEYLLRAKESSEALLDVDKNTSVYFNHPLLEKPYFYEFYHIASDIAGLFRKEFSYDYYFMPAGEDIEDLENYLKVLIEKGQGRPVLQCCRSIGRISWLCSRFGGIHIFLWRNPWDQWWSYKSDFCFERSNFLIVNSPYAPLWLQEIRNNLGIPTFHSNNLDEELQFFDSLKLAPLDTYILFYAIWCHAMLEARPRCDIVINIDSLAWQRSYRTATINVFESFGIRGIDFSDCIIPIGKYSDKEIRFFEDAEKKVHEVLLKHGYTKDVIDEIYLLRKKHLVSFASETDKYTAVVRHAEHIREYGLRSEASLKAAKDKIKELGNRLRKELKVVTELNNLFKQAEKKAEEERVRRAELEERWREVSKRNEDLSYQLGFLTEVKRKLEEALKQEKKVSSELNSFVEEVRKEAEAERARANELGKRLNDAIKGKEELSYQLGLLTEARKRLDEELERERTRTNELEDRLSEVIKSKEELSYQLGLLTEARKRLDEELEREKKISSELNSLVEEVRKEAEAERARANELGKRLNDAIKGKEELSYHLGLLTEARKKLEEELEQERTRANELKARYSGLEYTVQALYKSWSWRITYPLRLGLDALLASRRISIACFIKIWSIVTYPTAWILARAIKFVLNRSRFRQFLHKQLVRFPWIYWRLYNFAVSKGIAVGGIVAISQQSLEHEIDFMQDLSPRARQIYEDLKRAIENGREGRNI